jgi:NAD(P)-dependent dehydrogenase (short-subunit alcohol dehydrogenase family)
LSKVAIVTGAAQGMGLAIANHFLENEFNVLLADNNIEILKKEYEKLLIKFNKDKVLYFNLDITKTLDCDSLTEYAFSKWSQLDILVNCAGIAAGNVEVENMSDEVWEKTIDINLTGTFKICRSVIKYMKKNNFGRIVNISSMAGKDGNPKASHYSSSKAGVICFTKSLGKELALDNITVNCIAPAVIETPMIKDVTKEQLSYMLEKIPMKRMGTIPEVINLIDYLSSEKTSFSTGAVFDLSGGRATY